jgi:hemolysin D
VKIDAFPFTRYGILDGRIAAIAHDAVARSEVSQQMVSPGSSQRSTGLGGTQAVEDLVFPVIVALDRPSIEVDGVTVPLSPGMSAVAEIKTGTRRIIDYLLSPLAETGSEALRER